MGGIGIVFIGGFGSVFIRGVGGEGGIGGVGGVFSCRDSDVVVVEEWYDPFQEGEEGLVFLVSSSQRRGSRFQCAHFARWPSGSELAVLKV